MMRRLLSAWIACSAVFAGAQTFVNPIIAHGADPSVVFTRGMYYSVGGCSHGGGVGVCLRASPTLQGLKDTRPVQIWRGPDRGPNAADLWAPQIDVLRGELYIYYAADARGDNDHRLFALVPEDQGKPLGRWVEGQTGAPGGQLVTDWKSVWAIDPDVFQATDGKLYLLYACRQDNSGTEFGRSQSICLAPMKDPLHLDVDARTGKSVIELSQPRLAWERRGFPTEEGPFGFTHNGVDYILYSASFSGNPDQYAAGLLVNDHPPGPAGWTNSLLNAGAWVKVGPVFDGHHAAYGTASPVLVPSPDGTELWHVYHGTDCLLNCERVAGKTWRDRSDRAQQAWWTAGGDLMLGYPVDFANTDGTGRDVPLVAPSTDGKASMTIAAWGAAFGDAAEGDAVHGLVQGPWKDEAGAIENAGAAPAQRFYASNPNLQQYTVVAKVKRVDGAGAYGVYAAYVDHANYATVMIDGNAVVTNAVIAGKDQGEKRCSLPEGFQPDVEHALAVEVSDAMFRVLIDGRPVSGACQKREFLLLAGQAPDHGTNGQAGVRVEGGHARFADFHVIASAPTDGRKTNEMYALRNAASRLNLDNGCAGGCGGKPKVDAAVMQVGPAAPYPSTLSTTQLWMLRENNDGTYAVVSVLSGMCVEARGDGPVQEPCKREEKQAWWFVPAATGFVLENKSTAQALASSGARTVLEAHNGSAAETWMLFAQ
jgi:GH43 family beta-xylosidase